MKAQLVVVGMTPARDVTTILRWKRLSRRPWTCCCIIVITSFLVLKSVSDAQSLRSLSPGARRDRANHVVCCGENARSAFSPQHTKSGERRRREQEIMMEIGQTLMR